MLRIHLLRKEFVDFAILPAHLFCSESRGQLNFSVWNSKIRVSLYDGDSLFKLPPRGALRHLNKLPAGVPSLTVLGGTEPGVWGFSGYGQPTGMGSFAVAQ